MAEEIRTDERYVQCVVLRVYALRENGEMRVAWFLYKNRELHSGGVQPRQGWGRGFDPRLALFLFGGRRPAVLQDSGLFVLQVSHL